MTLEYSNVSAGSSSSPSPLRLASASSRRASASSATSSPAPSDEHAAAIAGLLHRLENSLDEAFGLAGELATTLTLARRDAKLSAVVGQPVFEAVAQTLAQTGSARGQAVAAHRLLEALANRFGIRAEDYGDGRKDPPPGFTGADASDLDVAA